MLIDSGGILLRLHVSYELGRNWGDVVVVAVVIGSATIKVPAGDPTTNDCDAVCQLRICCRSAFGSILRRKSSLLMFVFAHNSVQCFVVAVSVLEHYMFWDMGCQ